MAKPKAKAEPSKVELARAEFENVRRQFNDLRKPGVKCTPKQKSVAAAKYRAASLLIEAAKAQAEADEARQRADAALKDVEAAEKLKVEADEAAKKVKK